MPINTEMLDKLDKGTQIVALSILNEYLDRTCEYPWTADNVKQALLDVMVLGIAIGQADITGRKTWEQ